MAVTWTELADLRRRGLRPELPVYVTDRWMLARNMTDVGCVAILHKRGEPMPVRLLEGLDVCLEFPTCVASGRVARLIRERNVAPRSLRAWCRCARDFVSVFAGCDTGDEPWSD